MQTLPAAQISPWDSLSARSYTLATVRKVLIAGYLLVLGSFLAQLLYIPVYVPLERRMGTTIIATFGDSIFEGLYLAQRDGFPALLKKKLRADGCNVDVVNDGFSGVTTSYALSHVESIISQQPDIAILEFSTNDIAYGLPAQQTRMNLDQIMARLHQAGIRTLVTGQRAFPSRGARYAAEFNPIFCGLAKKYDALCYPNLFKAIQNQLGMIQTHYHPTSKGMKAIVDDMYPLVAELLKSLPKRSCSRPE